MHRRLLTILLFANAIFAQISFAQSPVLASHIPASNSANALVTSKVQLTFSQNMSNQTASANAVRIVSEWRGQLSGTYAGAGTPTITFTPAQIFLSGEPIRVTITKAATNQTGVAINHTTSYRYSISSTSGNTTFSNTTDIPIAYKVKDIVVADVDGDGKRDVLTANNSSSNAGTVNIRLGNGQGGFRSSADVALGGSPTSLALGDVNQDGKIDFVTANKSANSVSVRLGNGAGGFSGTTEIPVGQSPLQAELKDFNQDNKLDLVTVSAVTNAVSLRLGNGLGGFTTPTLPLNAEISVGANPMGLGVADINRDGYLDLVTVSNTSSNGAVSIRLGNGQGGFAATSTLALAFVPAGMLLQDINGDGVADLLLSHSSPIITGRGKVNVRLGNGMGSFASGTDISVGTQPGRLFAGDFNNDGKTDLATANKDYSYNFRTVSVRFGNGTGNFTGFMDWSMGQAPIDEKMALAVADMTGDNIPDLITASNHYVATTQNSNTSTMNLSIRPGNISGEFTGYLEVESGQGPTYTPSNYLAYDLYDAAIADINKDQRPDLIIGHNYSSSVGIKLNDGSGGFVSMPDVLLPTNSSPRTIAVGDVNNDGNIDFITANAGNTNASVRLGDGQGSFVSTSDVTLPGRPLQAYLDDVNNDGNLDLLTTLFDTYRISIKLGDGTGNFSGGSEVTGMGNQVFLEVVDLNNDGFLDLVAVDADHNSIYRRFGDGLGNFTGTNALAVSGSAIGVASGDVNNDGNVDLVVLATNSGTANLLNVYLGDGAGTLALSKSINSSVYNGNGLSLSDLNGDGLLDATLGTIDSSILLNFSGNGTGGFVYNSAVPVGSYVTKVISCDLDGDGDIDLIAPCYHDALVSVRLNGNQSLPLAVGVPQTILPIAKLTLVPNPARNTVQLVNSSTFMGVDILDILGRQIKHFPPDASSLDISGIDPGVYIVRDGKGIARLVIE